MQLVPEKQKELKEISTKFGATSLGPVTVAQVGSSSGCVYRQPNPTP